MFLQRFHVSIFTLAAVISVFSATHAFSDDEPPVTVSIEVEADLSASTMAPAPQPPSAPSPPTEPSWEEPVPPGSEVDSGEQASGERLANIGLVYPLSTSFTSTTHISPITLSAIVAVDGAIEGAAFAGVGSMSQRGVRGAQAGGVYVTNGGNLHGAQMAGVYGSSSGNIRGALLTGIAGVAGGDVHGMTASGVASIVGGALRGFHAAGVAAIAGGNANHSGFQAAGVAAIAGGDFVGMKAAGVAAITGGDFRGLSMGLVNVAGGDVQGVMMGLVNIGGEIDGVAFGLINLFENGIHDLILAYDSSVKGPTLSFRSGNQYLYSIVTAGHNALPAFAQDELHAITAGAGLGFAIRTDPGFWFGAEAQWRMEAAFDVDNRYTDDRRQEYIAYRANVGWKFADVFGLFASGGIDMIYHQGGRYGDLAWRPAFAAGLTFF